MSRAPAISISLLAAALAVGCLGGGACGGSTSETPWPAEPDESELVGPEGDEAPSNAIDARKLPVADRWRDAGADAAEPSDDVFE